MTRRTKPVSPRAHWGLFVMVALLLLVGVGISGFATHHSGPEEMTRSGPTGALGLPVGAGSVVDLTGPTVRTVGPEPGTVVLTFDDGPHPRWTPEILEVLADHDVPATFFVTGSQVTAEPGLARRIAREGHEIGSHTFNHEDVAAMSKRELQLQLRLTASAIAGATGIRTSLFRPPYSSGPFAVSQRDRASLERIADEGYLTVLSDLDSRDWTRPGADKIVEASTPEPGESGIVLLHDGGVDRTQTVEALDLLIPKLKRQGFTFRTVSDVVIGGDSVGSLQSHRDASTTAQVAGRSLTTLQSLAGPAVDAVPVLVALIGALALVRLALTLGLARRHVRRVRSRPIDIDCAPPVTIVVPAYNEEAGVAAAVTSLAQSVYPVVEVIVVDDGSTDGTAAAVEALDLPNVRLISQPNAGKPAALNTGIAAASHDIIVTVDGDTRFELSTLTFLVQPFSDPDVGAVSGNTKVVNRTGLLGRWQHIEYVMGFNLDRRMFEQLNCMPTVPGAIGAFRRPALRDAEGVHHDTLAEDTDLTMAINRAGWKVVYEERALAWTEAPSSIHDLWRQRYRWSYGTMQAMWKHRGAVLDRNHPGVGRRAIPYMVVFQVLFPLLAPLLDLWMLYSLVFLDPAPIAAMWVTFNLIQMLIAAYAFRLDGESLRPLWSVPLQQLFYRQLMYLVVIQSLVTAVMGFRLPWQRLERTGAINASPSAPDVTSGDQPTDRDLSTGAAVDGPEPATAAASEKIPA